MTFTSKKKIKLEFVIPESVAVGLSDLEQFLRERTDDIKVEENSYLSEVSSESSGKTPKSAPSTRKSSVASSESSEFRDYYGPGNHESVASDASVLSCLSEYSGLPANVVDTPASEPEGESLGSTDSTRSIDTESDTEGEESSFISSSESIHDSTVIKTFVRQNDEQELRLYHSKKRVKEPWNYPPAGGNLKRTRYY